LAFDTVRVWTDNDQHTAKGVILGPLEIAIAEGYIIAQGENKHQNLGIHELNANYLQNISDKNDFVSGETQAVHSHAIDIEGHL
jgi:hypothetical protein